LCAHAPPERGLVHEVRKGSLAVDLDDRNVLPIPRFEHRVARDVDLGQVEMVLAPNAAHNRERALAEVAIRRVVDDDVVGACGRVYG
jgi:hypothetical protein